MPPAETSTLPRVRLAPSGCEPLRRPASGLGLLLRRELVGNDVEKDRRNGSIGKMSSDTRPHRARAQHSHLADVTHGLPPSMSARTEWSIMWEQHGQGQGRDHGKEEKDWCLVAVVSELICPVMEGRGFTGCGKTRLCRHSERSFGVRQLAAAFLPASLLAGIATESITARQQAGSSQSGGPPRRTALQSGLRPRRLSWRPAPALTSFSAACKAPPFCFEAACLPTSCEATGLRYRLAHANNFFTTLPETSVRRKSRPWKR